MLAITDINQEYFGKEKSRNYLKHDFSSVLYGLVQRSVIIDVLTESSKARHKEKKHVDEKGNVSISRGDFDPDNAGFLWSVYESYQKGVMVDIRQLLTPNEAGAGGKFINEIAKLNVEAFMNYYKTPRAYTVPPMLSAKYLETKKENESLSIVDFVDAHHTEIEVVVNQLIKSVVDFQSKGHFNQIVKDYQALKFHKDNRPEKYDVTEAIEDLGAWKTNVTTRRDKASFEITKISKALNDFAEIIILYQALVGSNTSFLSTSWPLETYIERTFALFAKEVPSNIRSKVSEDVMKYLDKSLQVVGWRYTHPTVKSKLESTINT